ncbi:MAG: hypothetical protein ACOVOR_04905 [Rhabdochlamydiaceae bacterium]
MLSFFRKNQKIFFIFVTIVIVISFIFFGGNQSRNQGIFKVKDEKIGPGVKGGVISKRELELVKLILNANPELNQVNNRLPYLINNKFFLKEVVDKGVVPVLAKKYFPYIQRDLSKKWQNIRNYTPYEHPFQKDLSLNSLWKQFNLPIEKTLSALKNTEKPDQLYAFDLLKELYSAQTKISPDILKMLVAYQQMNEGIENSDRNLEGRDFYLFHYHSLEEWMGSDFLNILSQVVINGAFLAESEGIKISYKEAEKSLIEHLSVELKKIRREEDNGYLYIKDYLSQEAYGIGYDYKEVIKAWRYMLLFQALFEQKLKKIEQDPLMGPQLYTSDEEIIEAELYTLPAELSIKDYTDLMLCQIYLDRATDSASFSSWPTRILSVEEVYQNEPSLVEEKIDIAYAEVTLEDLLFRVSLKELWDWEVKNYQVLRKRFNDLFSKDATTDEERLSVLQNLPEKLKKDVEIWSREQIIKEKQNFKELVLNTIPTKQMSLLIREGSSQSSLKGIKDLSKLKYELAEKGPVLNGYTQDGSHFYKIMLTHKGDNRRVLSLKEARDEGVLLAILEKKFKSLYPQSSLSEKQKTFAEKLYPDLLKSIQDSMKENVDKINQDQQKDLYSYRFLNIFIEALLKHTPKENTLWSLEKKNVSLPVSSLSLNEKKALLSTAEGKESLLYISSNGEMSLAKVIKKKITSKVDEEKRRATKVLLEAQVIERQSSKLLQEIEDKKAVYLLEGL